MIEEFRSGHTDKSTDGVSRQCRGDIHDSTIAGRDIAQTTIEGNVEISGSDFIGHNQNIHGDVVRGDKVGGDKITVHDIKEAKGIAIGLGAQAIVNEIVNNITNITQQALSVVDEADKVRADALRILTENVRDYAQRLTEFAAQKNDRQQGGPYRGLVAYTLADAKLFFGRGQAIAEVLEHMGTNRLTVLQSESGAGKSSLLQAGIAPQLILNGHLPVILRPYDLSPSLKIKQTFLTGLENNAEFQAAPLRNFLQQVTRVLNQSTILYVVLDQFEEFFTLLKSDATSTAEQMRASFVRELADCLEDPSLNVRWVLVVRSEFFGDLASFRPRIPNPFDNDYRLNRLMHNEAKAVITEPAVQYQIQFEPALVKAILVDLQQSDGQIAPPQIQLVCQALYQAFKDSPNKDASLPNTITLVMYEQEERTKGILGRYLHRVLSRTFRTEEEQELARRLLVELVSSNHRRLRLRRSELAKRVATALIDSQGLDTVLKDLVDTHLVIVEKEDDAAEATYELAHDYLLSEIQVDPAVQAQKAAQEVLQQEVESYLRFKTLLSKDKFAIINSQRTLLVLDKHAEALLKQSEDALEDARQRELAQAQALAAEQVSNARTFRLAAIITAILLFIALVSASWAYDRQRAAQASAAAAQAQSTRAAQEADKALTREAEAKKSARMASAGELAARAYAFLNTGESAGSLPLRYSIDAIQATLQKDHYINSDADAALRRSIELAYWRMPIPRYRHTARITEVALSPDDKLIASASEDGTTRLWDLSSGTHVRTLHSNSDPVESVVFSPNGDKIATAGGDKSVRIWDTATGKLVQLFCDHHATIRTVRFSPNGKLIASADDQGVILLWNVADRHVIYSLAGHTKSVNSINFDPTGSLLVSGSDDQSITLWSVTTGKPIWTLSNLMARIESVVFSPNGLLIAAAGDNHLVWLWDTARHQEIKVIQGHRGRVLSVAFSHDGQSLASAADDGLVKLWNIQSGKEILTYAGHALAGSHPQSAVFSRDDKILVSGGDDRKVQIWMATNGHPIHILTGHAGSLFTAAYSPNGKLIATGSKDKTIKLWDAESGEEVRTLLGHTDNVESVVFAPNGQSIVSGSEDATVRLWDVATGQEIRTFLGHQSAVRSVDISPNSSLIVSGSDDATIRIWDVVSKKTLKIITGHSKTVHKVAFSPDGTKIASCSKDGTIKLWDVATGALTATFIGHTGDILSVAFNSDGAKLVSGGEDRTVRVWNVETQQTIRTFQGHTDKIRTVAFGSDGNFVASGSNDFTIRLWNLVTGEAVRVLKGHTDWVQSVAFSPDSLTLASTSGGSGTSNYILRLWNVSPLVDRNMLRGHIGIVRWSTFSPDHRYIASGGDDSTIRIWDAESSTLLQVLKEHTDRVRTLNFSRSGELMVSASDDNTLRLWSTSTWTVTKVLIGHTGWVRSAFFSSDNQSIVSASEDGTVRLWDVASGRMIHQFNGHTDRVMFATFSPDRKTIVSAAFDGTVRLWDIASQTEIQVFHTGAQNNNVVQYSPDGQLLAIGMEEPVDDSYVQLLNLKTRTRIACCKYKGPARTLAFSGDGQYFVAAGANAPVIVWNLKAGTEWRWLTEHAKPVWSVSFSPNDKFIVTSSEDETVHIWFTDIYNLLGIAEALIQPDPPVFKPEIRSSLLPLMATEPNVQDENAISCEL